jgi:cellobiose phosphorylase
MASRFDRLHDAAPQARILSNGRYAAFLTGAGTGYSACSGYALTGWNGDRTEDADGLFVYLRDLDSSRVWSVGYQPFGDAADDYRADYAPGRVTIERRDDGIQARLAACVVADEDVEIRCITLRNLSTRVRRIELTTYGEVVLGDAAAHTAHPAFSKLFVQTEYAPEPGVLLAYRRPRSRTEHFPWLMHALIGGGALQHETDRVRFVGRGRMRADPVALTASTPLSGTIGSVLDPIVSFRRVVRLDPGDQVEAAMLLGVAQSREAALVCAAGYARPLRIEAAFAGAAEHERTLLLRLGMSEEESELFQDVAGAMVYGDPRIRADSEVIHRSRGALSDLAKYGIEGGRLLALVEVDTAALLAVVHDLAKASAYWQAKTLRADVLVVCATPELGEAVRRAGGAEASRIIVRRRDQIAPADLDLLRTAAHLVISGRQALADCRAAAPVRAAAESSPRSPKRRHPAGRRHDARIPGLLFWNGYGGFTSDGSEYVIDLDAERRPPMPWINVIANEDFGFLVSESGAGYTWSRNSREHRLTPWYNDPVSDPYGEALYVRDEDTGGFWSPLPGPVLGTAACEVRHGFGYSQWRHAGQDLAPEVLQFVPRRDPVKITRLRLTNSSDQPRRLSIFAYYRLVLGVLPDDSGRFVVTELDTVSGALLARNRLSRDFSDGIAFVAAAAPEGTEAMHYTGDRTAFIGRNGRPDVPAALLGRAPLDGRTGAGLDPCAAVQVVVGVAPRSTVDCVFLLGETLSESRVREIVEHYRRPGAVDGALEEVRAFWAETLSAIRVVTPSRQIDVMVNGWLLYQTLSCRLWGRSALYQSGGAFGFRDQLQDAAALVYTRPDLTRAQILLHASHQFVEGDVLHWWHPPAGRGTRTRFSDDRLWLPYITAHYVHTTGDWSLLDESAGFMRARALAPGEDEAYVLPSAAAARADLYAHCCLTLDRSLTQGAHGLPLMGSGDWNDGMNRVGREGRGESIWLGFFLSRIIDQFVPICERRGDRDRVQRYRAYQRDLHVALNAAGWDGQWYRRAYYDDGTPLGSADNEECRIDALAQAWAVLSGVAPRTRAAQAMDAVERQLVLREAGLIRLLTPPFDRDPHDPGYIKGYVPGIRENGGQYTHAAVWVVQALAALGRREHAAAYLEMLGPVQHSCTMERVATYQVEPYVVAADIYGLEPHLGRGGWTWYTGSAGWMYRAAVESILGVHVENGRTMWIKPCVPDAWPGFSLAVRLASSSTRYEISVRNPQGCAAAVQSVTVDDQSGVVENGAARIQLVHDGAVHRVAVILGA